jgi:hypothetical protein
MMLLRRGHDIRFSPDNQIGIAVINTERLREVCIEGILCTKIIVLLHDMIDIAIDGESAFEFGRHS